MYVRKTESTMYESLSDTLKAGKCTLSVLTGVRIKRTIREFKQIATAGAATAIVVKEVWGEYFAVARQNSTLSNAKYK